MLMEIQASSPQQDKKIKNRKCSLIFSLLFFKLISRGIINE